MAVKVVALTRSFQYAGVSLPDPGAQFTPEQVKGFFAPVYPELNNSDVAGPEVRGNKLVYTFSRSVEVKG